MLLEFLQKYVSCSVSLIIRRYCCFAFMSAYECRKLLSYLVGWLLCSQSLFRLRRTNHNEIENKGIIFYVLWPKTAFAYRYDTASHLYEQLIESDPTNMVCSFLFFNSGSSRNFCLKFIFDSVYTNKCNCVIRNGQNSDIEIRLTNLDKTYWVVTHCAALPLYDSRSKSVKSTVSIRPPLYR